MRHSKGAYTEKLKSTTMRQIRVASVQMEHSAGDKSRNFEKIRAFVDRAREAGAEILLFPECCITGYWFLKGLDRDEIEALAEPVPEGPSTQELMELSVEHGITIGAGLVEEGEDGSFYNAFVVTMPDETWARHRKIHCFISEHMSCGSEYTVFDSPHGCRLGVLTCYDNNLIENARITALKGAEVLLAPHQTGGCQTGDPDVMGVIDRRLWEEREENPEAIEAEFRGEKGRGWLMRWLPSRAHDNGMFLVFSNGVGVDGDEIRTGNAMILDPYGRILTETCKAGDDIVVADLAPALRENNSGQRWMSARRPDLYETLTEPTGKERNTREARFFYEE